MTNVYSADGIFAAILLVICAMAYFKRVPRMKRWLLSEKRGFWGALYKASVIGTRLHWMVSLLCIGAGVSILFK